MQKHFVIFSSPGTFFAEQSSHPIDQWDTATAIELARTVKERHGATPYGFQFVTRERGEDDLDSHEIGRSGMYYLGGTVETLAQVKARNDPDDRILISNMEGNGWDRIITNTNSWKVTRPLLDGDTVLEFTP